MNISIKTVSKNFNQLKAVDNVSFEVSEGQVFGLLGPNGAGKTTLIRMMMDIIKPDSGEILVDDKFSISHDKGRIGYLPEERGLYKKQVIWEVISYFGILKGMDPKAAKIRTCELLDKLGMADAAKKKVEELSKGNQQKIQIISTIVHNPDFIVLDEPFTGLDPVNLRLVRSLVLELSASGRTIILSTHLMNQVEELCSDIFMINKGKGVLYGSLTEIKDRFAGDALYVDSGIGAENLDCVEKAESFGAKMKVVLKEGKQRKDFLLEMTERNIFPRYFESAAPPLEDIFIKTVEAENAG